MERILVFTSPESFDEYKIVEDKRIFTKDLNGIGTVLLSGYGLFNIEDNDYPKFFKRNLYDEHTTPEWDEITAEAAYNHLNEQRERLCKQLDQLLVGISTAKRKMTTKVVEVV